jgi:alpha-ketoglutarate-dependent taurine dioxygenase
MNTIRSTPSGHFDNSPRPYRNIMAVPISGAMGAEIVGDDIVGMSDDVLAEVLDALCRHKMVFLRNQQLDHAQHEAFSKRLGEFAEYEFGKGLRDFPFVQALIKEPSSSPILFGGGWHTDTPFIEKPPAITTLRSVEVPPYGGDTMWTDLALAYRMLSPAMQTLIDSLKIHMSPVGIGTLNIVLSGSTPMPIEPANPLSRGWIHPLVRTHPVTGQKTIYVDETYATRIVGLPPAEGEAILQFLTAHVTQHAFTCRLRWEPDMFVMWDNRQSLHHACNDYDDYRREMYRTTIQGDIPT